MPPKSNVVIGCVSYHEGRLDEIIRLIRNYVELKCGFGETHQLSRTMQNIFKQFDLNHKGTMGTDELFKSLDFMNIAVTADELEGVWERINPQLPDFLTHKEVADAISGNGITPFTNLEARAVIKKFRDILFTHSSSGEPNAVGNLSRALLAISNDNNSLSKEELFNCLQKNHISCTINDVDTLLKVFDTEKEGRVSLPAFLRAVRGHLTRARQDLIIRAFQRLDASGSGSISVQDIGAAFAASENGSVQDFMSGAGWDRKQDGNVSIEEWHEYFEELSAGIDRDSEFETMMSNVWHVSSKGEAGGAALCRRVLVTYKDGSQSIEEVADDFVIGNDNKKKIQADLEARGINNIIKLELYS